MKWGRVKGKRLRPESRKANSKEEERETEREGESGGKRSNFQSGGRVVICPE